MPDITVRERRFKVGAAVNLKIHAHHRGTPNGVYKIVRLMPAEGQDYQYRIKDSRTGSEYAVRESELE